MLSLLRSRCSGSFCAVYWTNVKFAHRISGGRRRGLQQSWSGQENEDFRNEMGEDAEELEDINSWFEANVAKPDFQKAVASEEEKLKKKIMHKMIEHKYYKKPQEVCLLTWDAKEQIRFLHNEYPEEWTVDRLAESFPTSREGIIKILKSRFQPKSLAEIVKHDERVHRNWKELQDGKAKGLAAGGPVTSRYQALLKSAAGNPSLPMPYLNQLLLPSGKAKRETAEAGIFLSIVNDYCEKRQGTKDAGALKQVKSGESDQLSALEDHLAHNRKLIEGVSENIPKYPAIDRKLVKQSPNHFNQNGKPIKGMAEKSPNHFNQNGKPIKGMAEQSRNHFNQNGKPIKGMVEQSLNHLSENRKQVSGMIEQSQNHFNRSRIPIKGKVEQSPNRLSQNRKLPKVMAEQLPKHSEGKHTDLYKTLESETHSYNVHLSKSVTQSMDKEMLSKQLIDSDFEVSFPDNEADDSMNLVSVTSQRQSRSLRRRSVNVNVAKEERNWVDEQITDDGGLQGTKKFGVSEDVLNKMEENARLALEVDKSGSRHAVDKRSKEALQSMKVEDVEDGTETYMFSKDKGYQHPFGQMKDLPGKRIKVPRNKLKSGVEFKKGDDFYDEDGEFLYRTP